jgi:hypothetical protein
LGVRPTESEGAASVEANVRFPLNRTLSFDDVEMALGGRLDEVRMNNALVEGPVSSSLQFEHRQGSGGRLDVSLLLKSSRFSLPFTSWAKAPGVEGRAELSLDMDGARPLALSRLDIDAGDLRVRGSARFDTSGGRISSLHLDDFDLQETRLRDVSLVWRDGGLTAEIGSGTVDAARFVGKSPSTRVPDAEVRAPAVRSLREEPLDGVKGRRSAEMNIPSPAGSRVAGKVA